jgi:hypothetical protein
MTVPLWSKNVDLVVFTKGLGQAALRKFVCGDAHRRLASFVQQAVQRKTGQSLSLEEVVTVYSGADPPGKLVVRSILVYAILARQEVYLLATGATVDDYMEPIAACDKLGADFHRLSQTPLYRTWASGAPLPKVTPGGIAVLHGSVGRQILRHLRTQSAHRPRYTDEDWVNLDAVLGPSGMTAGTFACHPQLDCTHVTQHTDGTLWVHPEAAALARRLNATGTPFALIDLARCVAVKEITRLTGRTKRGIERVAGDISTGTAKNAYLDRAAARAALAACSAADRDASLGLSAPLIERTFADIIDGPSDVSSPGAHLHELSMIKTLGRVPSPLPLPDAFRQPRKRKRTDSDVASVTPAPPKPAAAANSPAPPPQPPRGSVPLTGGEIVTFAMLREHFLDQTRPEAAADSDRLKRIVACL